MPDHSAYKVLVAEWVLNNLEHPRMQNDKVEALLRLTGPNIDKEAARALLTSCDWNLPLVVR
jgi:hypothetical protein